MQFHLGGLPCDCIAQKNILSKLYNYQLDKTFCTRLAKLYCFKTKHLRCTVRYPYNKVTGCMFVCLSVPKDLPNC